MSFKFQVSGLKFAAVVTAYCLLLTLFTACPKTKVDQNVAFARDVAGAVKAGCDAAIKKDASKWRARCDTAVADANKLIDAFASSDATNIATLVRGVLPVFTDLATEFTHNDVILGLMAGGQIALNFFINHYVSEPPAVAGGPKAGKARAAMKSDDNDAVDNFRALPQFGCRLKPEKCQ
jgi:post-segregation antitoxin (ccd killing protein)